MTNLLILNNDQQISTCVTSDLQIDSQYNFSCRGISVPLIGEHILDVYDFLKKNVVERKKEKNVNILEYAILKDSNFECEWKYCRISNCKKVDKNNFSFIDFNGKILEVQDFSYISYSHFLVNIKKMVIQNV